MTPKEHAKLIGATNAESARDQEAEYEEESYTALAAYLVNTVDTARRWRHVSPELAVEHFLQTYHKPNRKK